MGDDGNVTLTKGDSSSGAIDIGEILFDTLEAEGEDSFVMSSEVNGDSMKSLLTGAMVVFTGMGTQEQAQKTLKNTGAEYSPSNITMKNMNRMCDQKMASINKMGSADTGNNKNLYVVIGLVSALAVIIAIPMFIMKK